MSRDQELSEVEVLPVQIVLMVSVGRKATLEEEDKTLESRSCVKVEVAVQYSPSLIVLMVSVDVKQRSKKKTRQEFRALELCKSRGGRPRLPVPNSSYGLFGRKATLEEEDKTRLQSPGAV